MSFSPLSEHRFRARRHGVLIVEHTGRVGLLERIHNNMIGWGFGQLPVWVTETGLAEPEARKSEYLTCFYGKMRERASWWRKTFWYRYEYERGGNGSFGLLDGGPGPCQYTPNATYFTYRDFIRQGESNQNP